MEMSSFFSGVTSLRIAWENALFRALDETSALDQLEAEFIQDRWDARNIPGLRYQKHSTNYYILFTNIPAILRPSVKEYAKFLISSDWAAATIIRRSGHLGRFL